MTDTIKSVGIGIAGLSLLALAVFLIVGQSQQAFSSTIAESSDYKATSTAPNAFYGATTGGFLVKTGQGSFGSVNVTGANTGALTFYNATTTDINKRTGNTATSSILLASLPPSLVAGTYIFDIGYTTGLLIVLEPGGIMPTTTISYR